MRVWRMSLRRTKSTIISWDGSNNDCRGGSSFQISPVRHICLLVYLLIEKIRVAGFYIHWKINLLIKMYLIDNYHIPITVQILCLAWLNNITDFNTVVTYEPRREKTCLQRLCCSLLYLDSKMSRDMTKPTKWVCAQRRLRSTWASAQSDQSSLSAWRNLGFLPTHWAHSEESDQTGPMTRLIWVFVGRTGHFVGFVMSWLKYVC